MKTILKTLFHLIIFGLLTILTQIGGLIYLLSLVLTPYIKRSFKFKRTTVFLSLYLIATFLLVPIVAPLFGREKIVKTDKISATNVMTVLLNRNYVQPQLNVLLKEVEQSIKNQPFEINYLDANFPFINKFPLLPHLSHSDGKKIDISLIYETKEGKLTNKQKSISGYGVFEGPKKSESDQISRCKSKGYFQYDFPKYLTFGSINKNLQFSKKGTRKLINSFLKSSKVSKIFIEPHLKQRLNLRDKRVRYHGCQAVRHDDHIHIEIQ